MSAPILTPAWIHGRSYTFFFYFLALRTVTDLRQKRYICIQIPLRVSAHVLGVFHDELPRLQQLHQPVSAHILGLHAPGRLRARWITPIVAADILCVPDLGDTLQISLMT